MPQFVKVCSKDEIASGTGKICSVNGKDFAVFNINGNFYCLGNTCPHMGGPLGEGEVLDLTVTCPWHGLIFDVKTGKATPDAWDPNAVAKNYEVKVEGNDVLVAIE